MHSPESCHPPGYGANCSMVFADYFGAAYVRFQIAYLVLTAVYMVSSTALLVSVLRRPDSGFVHRAMFSMATAAGVLMLARAFDPLGYKTFDGRHINMLLSDLTTAAIWSTAVVLCVAHVAIARLRDHGPPLDRRRKMATVVLLVAVGCFILLSSLLKVFAEYDFWIAVQFLGLAILLFLCVATFNYGAGVVVMRTMRAVRHGAAPGMRPAVLRLLTLMCLVNLLSSVAVPVLVVHGMGHLRTSSSHLLPSDSMFALDTAFVGLQLLSCYALVVVYGLCWKRPRLAVGQALLDSASPSVHVAEEAGNAPAEDDEWTSQEDGLSQSSTERTWSMTSESRLGSSLPRSTAPPGA